VAPAATGAAADRRILRQFEAADETPEPCIPAWTISRAGRPIDNAAPASICVKHILQGLAIPTAIRMMAAVVHQEPDRNPRREPAQVLKFERRPGGGRPPLQPRLRPIAPDPPGAEPIDDFAQFEEDAGPIDYRHRMLMNVIAVAVVTLLVGVGVWLADTIAAMERDQDCVLQGRQNCAPIVVPAPRRQD
jgi:hypothetical protein